jgi:uncharacterized protein (DUF983 family)
LKEHQEEEKQRGYLTTILTQKCPRCREGNIFEDQNPYHLKALFKMKKNCPVCGQPTEIEPGFYYGTAYVSYSLTIAFSVTTFVIWWVLIGFSTNDNRIFFWMCINGALMIFLQPFFMRLSRSLWLSFFVKYDATWRD